MSFGALHPLAKAIDLTAAVVALGALVHALPYIAAGMTVIWYTIRFIVSPPWRRGSDPE